MRQLENFPLCWKPGWSWRALHLYSYGTFTSMSSTWHFNLVLDVRLTLLCYKLVLPMDQV